ncbi:MAG: 16S rRNA (guanine(527)-N(7))-methyltransferase RsmG [Woeseia sp.]
MNSAQLSDAIESGVAALGQELPAGAGAKLAHLIAELARWNARINLTSVRDVNAMVSAHVLDSLAVRPYLTGPTTIDIGTGAGFPGLPLAIAEPGRSVELLDSSGKKQAFVRHIIGELGIANAVAIKARAEHYAPGIRFDTVVARAFAAIPELIELAGHLVGDTGVLLAQKGKYPHDELRQFMDMPELSDLWDYDVTELKVPGLETRTRHIVSLRRRKSFGTRAAAT